MDGIRIKNNGGAKRYLGITAEAARLGVSRIHLWKVLQGERESARIMREVKINDERETMNKAPEDR